MRKIKESCKAYAEKLKEWYHNNAFIVWYGIGSAIWIILCIIMNERSTKKLYKKAYGFSDNEVNEFIKLLNKHSGNLEVGSKIGKSMLRILRES